MKKTPIMIIGLAAALAGCNEKPGVGYETYADSLFAVINSDREIYTKKIVQRLGPNGSNSIKPLEEWHEVDNGAPLPAQMFRYGSELSSTKTDNFTYSLQSKWPINKQNAAKTKLEKQGLEFVADPKNAGKNFYGEEDLGGKTYFTAVYADTGISEACISCHNEHKNSPKTDFVLNDVLGGVVIRIPIK